MGDPGSDLCGGCRNPIGQGSDPRPRRRPLFRIEHPPAPGTPRRIDKRAKPAAAKSAPDPSAAGAPVIMTLAGPVCPIPAPLAPVIVMIVQRSCGFDHSPYVSAAHLHQAAEAKILGVRVSDRGRERVHVIRSHPQASLRKRDCVTTDSAAQVQDIRQADLDVPRGPALRDDGACGLFQAVGRKPHALRVGPKAPSRSSPQPVLCESRRHKFGRVAIPPQPLTERQHVAFVVRGQRCQQGSTLRCPQPVELLDVHPVIVVRLPTLWLALRLTEC